jgi:hypothetical protein
MDVTKVGRPQLDLDHLRFGGCLDTLDNAHIASATTQIPNQGFSYIIFTWIGITIKQGTG